MNKEKTNSLDMSILWKVIILAFPFKNLLIATTAFAFLLALMGPIRPELIQRLIDNSILGGQGSTQILIILILASLVLESIFNYIFIFVSNKLGQSVVKELRTKVFEHVVNLNLNYFDKTPIGTTTTRTVSDIETINSIFTQGFIQLLADILTLIVIISAMFFSSWQLALISLITLPFMLLSTYLFKESVKVAFNKVRTEVAHLNAFLQERISGMRIVQIFGAEKQEYQKFEAINQKHQDANIEAIWAYSIFFPVVEVLQAVAVGLLVWFGADLLIKNNLLTSLGNKADVGLIIQFVLLINLMFRPIRFMADRFNTLQMGVVAAKRVLELLDYKNSMPNIGKINNAAIQGDIVFKNVDFSYNENEPILKNISFHLPAGKTLAIIGHTGSGKSSIINILGRLYDFQNGEVLLDNVRIQDYELNFYRKQFSSVLQDVFLFSGTIFDNIRLLDTQITDEEIINAAKLIGAHEFIQNLPNGYNFQVMERGSSLSLGQRQLISFIRALVFNPKILILDEATSSVDSETEFLVQAAINKLTKNRTSIIIAHRLATIQNADYILILDNGIIIEIGEKQALLEKEGVFKNLNQSFLQKNNS